MKSIVMRSDIIQNDTLYWQCITITEQFWEITVNNHIIVTIRNTDQSQMIPTYFYQQRDIMHAKYASSTVFYCERQGDGA
jgi:hypothetical protein